MWFRGYGRAGLTSGLGGLLSLMILWLYEKQKVLSLLISIFLNCGSY